MAPRTILLKLSGEALIGEKNFGIDTDVLEYLSKEISDVKGKFSGSTGFLRAALSNESNIVIYNTKGDLQINEPLEVNGISVGRNVGVSTDFEFSDVKSVSSAVGGGGGKPQHRDKISAVWAILLLFLVSLMQTH